MSVISVLHQELRQFVFPASQDKVQFPVKATLRQYVEVHVVGPQDNQHQPRWGHRQLNADRCLLGQTKWRSSNFHHAHEGCGLVRHADHRHWQGGAPALQTRRRQRGNARENLVARQDTCQCGTQHLGVDAASYPSAARYVVRRHVRIRRLQTQHLLLAEGERPRRGFAGVGSDALDRRHHATASARIYVIRPARRYSQVLETFANHRECRRAVLEEGRRRGQATSALWEGRRKPTAKRGEALGRKAGLRQRHVLPDSIDAQNAISNSAKPREDRRGLAVCCDRGCRRVTGGQLKRGYCRNQPQTSTL
mmetsp:Transcript_25174/g.70158  ORF Transcript_25174/g.70158 Transcript_25174/m.70158 type:complete len:308 (-) Transcript_25174:70-993(-)